MEVFSKMDLIEEFAFRSIKWCIYVSTIEIFDIEGLKKAIPFLKQEQYYLLLGNFLILTFDTEKEMEEHFNLIVGDDGPTLTNNYNGNVRVYALTCSNKGEFLNENT